GRGEIPLRAAKLAALANRLGDESLLGLDRELTRRIVRGLEPRGPAVGTFPDQGRDLVRDPVQVLLVVEQRLLLLREEDPRVRDRSRAHEPCPRARLGLV